MSDGEKRRGDWMTTFTGQRYWPLDPRPEDVRLEDIAHALARLCHWNGHCREFISVAQHSVMVARMLPDRLRALGLLHDAHEAYVGDMIRPVHHCLSPAAAGEFTALKRLSDRAIFDKFGIEPTLGDLEAVKEADNCVLATEARDQVNSDIKGERWWEGGLAKPYDWMFFPWDMEEAKGTFRAMARECGLVTP